MTRNLENDMTNHVPAWLAKWQRTLAPCHKVLFTFDLDGTVWPDILSVSSEHFGSVDPDGVKRWRRIEHAYKVAGAMSNGDHLEALFADIFERHTMNDMIEWLQKTHRLLPNFKRFLKLLEMFNVSPVGISNGASQIASRMLTFHGIEMPVIANPLAFDKDGKFTGMDFVHDREEGVRKGLMVKAARDLGYRVIGCAGDSKGDIDMADETLKVPGTVVISYDKGILNDWCKARTSDADRCLNITDWARAELFMTKRLQALR